MDLLLDKRSKRLVIEHQKEHSPSPPPSEPPAIVIQAAENETEEIQPGNNQPVQTQDRPVQRQEMIPEEVFEEENSQPISPGPIRPGMSPTPGSDHDTSAEIETIEINQDEEIQEINIKMENLSDEISPEESQNLQEVIHHKSGPIREEGADYIIYRPERKQFEKTESGEFQCSDCSYTNSKYSLGRVPN